MREILVNVSAPNRETALAMMAALKIADIVDGQPVPYRAKNLAERNVQVHIAEVPHTGTRSLWNFWYYGDSAATLMKPEPEGGWLPEHDLFDRTHLLDMVDARTGIAMEWAAFVGEDGEPPGFVTPTGIRLYDPALIASADLVKQ